MAPQPTSYTPGNAYRHTVIRGETLDRIARHYGIDYHDIMRANNLNNAAFIMVGQLLVIPDYQPTPAYHPPAPAHGYHDKPEYAPPPGIPPVGPPPAPGYDASYDDHGPPPPRHPPHDGVVSDKVHQAPPPPEYQPFALSPLLPEANHPIEVVVNGGASWIGQVFTSYPDPDNITTLIVSTDKMITPTVKLQSGDYVVKGEFGLVPEFGIDKPRFVFRYIPPGDYDVWIDDPAMPSERAQVEVEPGKRVEVSFREGLLFSGPTFASPDGWVLASWDNPSEPGKNLGGWSNILVKTPASGLWIIIESEGGGYRAKCFTGTKGPGACDFAGLNPGLYWIWIDGTQLTLKTYMDGNAYATFEFARQPTSSSEDRDKIGPVTYSDD